MEDFCTCWPDEWLDVDFSICCAQHDKDYAALKLLPWWKREFARSVADWRLAKCVHKKFVEKGYKIPLMDILMFLGVRNFGWIYAYFGKEES